MQHGTTIHVLNDVTGVCAKFNGFPISATANLVASKHLSSVLLSRHHHIPSGGAEQRLQTVRREVHHLLAPTHDESGVATHFPFFRCSSKSSPASELPEGLMSITSSVHNHLFVTPKWPVSIVIIPLGDNAMILDKFPLNL